MTRKYSVLLADPPWSAGQRGALGAEAHYNLMSDERIKTMGGPIRDLMAPDSVCWLWVTNATIQTGHEVLTAWGFRYASILTWIKPRLGLGQPLRNMTEHVLLGVRGRVPVTFRSQGTWLFAPVQEHSHKPEELYDIIERLYPDGGRLELFARRRRHGWDAWGNEVESDVQLAGYPVPRGPQAQAGSGRDES